MNNEDVLEIKKLDNDDLLSLYDSILNHLKYLEEKKVDVQDEGGDEENE